MGQDHSLPAELKRFAEAAIKQGILNLQPGETLDIDLSDQSEYVHAGPMGVNVLMVRVQRPTPNG